MSRARFEHVRKVCRRWQRRYARKGFGVLGKQHGKRRSKNRSIEIFLGGARDELATARQRTRRHKPTGSPMPSSAPLPGRANRSKPDDRPSTTTNGNTGGDT
jgi:hypothetical protein